MEGDTALGDATILPLVFVTGGGGGYALGDPTIFPLMLVTGGGGGKVVTGLSAIGGPCVGAGIGGECGVSGGTTLGRATAGE